ncbi:MAG: hypothetical protein COS95_00150 [Ignavibacteriales bacterium CG07_land_8_20_14_0_80_59_12]|nr:MAG: hypothetical protein COS95_00150 [Ignavibacteriales bacterium CG07_land_8_20_14_0_80_59_12]
MDESKSKLIEAMRDNWRREVLGARAYRARAAREKDKKRRGILIRLTEMEMTIVGVVEAAITYFLGVLLSSGHPTL